MRTRLSSSRCRRLATAVAVVLCSCYATSAVALDPDKAMGDYVYKSWTPEEGLPHLLVYAVLQTRDGYIWLGTQDGLVRFDGVRFKVFDVRNTPQMVEGTIRALAETPDGTLWASPLRSDLLRRQGDRIERLTDWLSALGPRTTDASLFVDSRGTLWVAASEGIARRGDDGQLRVVAKTDARTAASRVIGQDSQGRIWWTPTDGTRVVKGDRIERVPLADGAQAIYGAPDGRLWFGLNGRGLQVYRDGRVTPVPLPSKVPLADLRIRAIRADRQGNLWIGTNDGLFRLQPDRGNACETAPIAASQVEDIIEGAQGNLWLATRGGLVEIKDPAFRTYHAVSGLQEVLALIQDHGGTIWFVTVQSPYLQRIVGGQAEPVAGRLPDGIQTVYQDRQGRMLLGTRSGLYVQEAAAWLRVPGAPQVSITTIAQDQTGVLWLAETGGRIHQVSGSSVTSFGPAEGLPRESVESFHCASDGTLWIATQRGAFQLKGGKVHPVKLADSGAEPRVRYVGEDQQGAIWLGSRLGLTRIKNGKLHSFGVKQGIPDPVVNAVVDDQHGNLWVACSKGVFRVAKSAFERVVSGEAAEVSVLLYSRRDGIEAGQAWGTTALRARDGSLWFPTTRGVAAIPAARLAERETPLPVYIEEVVINGKARDPNAHASVEPGDGRLEFRFTALNFDAPERTEFRYKLEGLDKDWRNTDRLREATYTNVGDGDYTFRVEARTANGTWGKEAKTFSFSMKPHFIETPWFYLLMALLVGGLGFAAYRWRVAALRSQQRDLALKVDERTADLSREIAKHKKTEEQLESQMAEREHAEQEARQFAEKLAESNTTLTERQRAIERENAERRRAEEEARRAGAEAGRERDLLRALMDNIPDLIYFKDSESRFTRINKAHADALGLKSPEEAAGKSDFDFHPAEFARASREDEREILMMRRPLVGRVEHEAQRERWYLATKVPLLDAAGQATGLVGISKDITDRKRTEEQLERDLQAFLEVVKAVAKGDLAQRGKESEDTLGRIARSVNQMLDGFASIVSELRDAALSMSTSSTEILAAATQIAKGAKSGSDQVHSTSAAVEEMAASMAQVSKNAQQSADSSKQVLDHVRAGNDSVAATYQGMTKIDATVSETVQKMKLLEQSSGQIFSIIALIEEIASQSNLLSLNAAIEAAHAGDAGRGFGVVAEEIRRLAERSSVATKDVTTIVEGIVAETRSVLQAMESGTDEVRAGRRLSEQAQKSLQDIQGLAQASAQLSDSISAASSEQARATQTVAQAMQTIAGITQESSAGATETSRAVRDLVSLSEQLNRTISVFRIDASGTTPKVAGTGPVVKRAS